MIENENRVTKIPPKIKKLTTYLVCILETWMDSVETWCAG
jgi:hypothetical protein